MAIDCNCRDTGEIIMGILRDIMKGIWDISVFISRIEYNNYGDIARYNERDMGYFCVYFQDRI